MPCVIYKGNGKDSYYEGFPRNTDGTVSYYMLPPIKYPDGTVIVDGHVARLFGLKFTKRIPF